MKGPLGCLGLAQANQKKSGLGPRDPEDGTIATSNDGYQYYDVIRYEDPDPASL